MNKTHFSIPKLILLISFLYFIACKSKSEDPPAEVTPPAPQLSNQDILDSALFYMKAKQPFHADKFLWTIDTSFIPGDSLYALRIQNQRIKSELEVKDVADHILLLKRMDYEVVEPVDAVKHAEFFQDMAYKLKGYLVSENPAVVKKAHEFQSQLVAIQKREFPKLRAKYAKIMDNNLWEKNMDAKANGTTISYVGALFADNKQIADWESFSRTNHEKLRFKQSRYYWYDGSEYTYYTIHSLKDGELY